MYGARRIHASPIDAVAWMAGRQRRTQRVGGMGHEVVMGFVGGYPRVEPLKAKAAEAAVILDPVTARAREPGLFSC